MEYHCQDDDKPVKVVELTLAANVLRATNPQIGSMVATSQRLPSSTVRKLGQKTFLKSILTSTSRSSLLTQPLTAPLPRWDVYDGKVEQMGLIPGCIHRWTIDTLDSFTGRTAKGYLRRSGYDFPRYRSTIPSTRVVHRRRAMRRNRYECVSSDTMALFSRMLQEAPCSSPNSGHVNSNANGDFRRS